MYNYIDLSTHVGEFAPQSTNQTWITESQWLLLPTIQVVIFLYLSMYRWNSLDLSYGRIQWTVGENSIRKESATIVFIHKLLHMQFLYPRGCHQTWLENPPVTRFSRVFYMENHQTKWGYLHGAMFDSRIVCKLSKVDVASIDMVETKQNRLHIHYPSFSIIYMEVS